MDVGPRQLPRSAPLRRRRDRARPPRRARVLRAPATRRRDRPRRLALQVPHRAAAPRAVVADGVRPGRRPAPAQAVPRRPPRPLPARRPARHRLLPVDLPPRRGRPPPPPARRRHPRPPALQRPPDLRLRPRPARDPAQRVGARLPPGARRRLPRLGRRDARSTRPPGCAASTSASTTTGQPKACTTTAPRSGLPRRRSSRSPATTPDAPSRLILIEYDRTRRLDKNYDKFRRYDAFLTWWWQHTHLADRESPAVRRLRLPRRRAARPLPRRRRPRAHRATAGTPTCHPSATSTSGASASSSRPRSTPTRASSKLGVCRSSQRGTRHGSTAPGGC